MENVTSVLKMCRIVWSQLDGARVVEERGFGLLLRAERGATAAKLLRVLRGQFNAASVGREESAARGSSVAAGARFAGPP